jgi:hypothetical protein
MQTGLKLKLKLKRGRSWDDGMPVLKRYQKAETPVWGKLEQASINVELKFDEARGWRIAD